jgi:hypothetical protein
MSGVKRGHKVARSMNKIKERYSVLGALCLVVMLGALCLVVMLDVQRLALLRRSGYGSKPRVASTLG